MVDKQITDKIARKLEETRPLRDLFLAIDDIDKLNWDLPEALSAEEWARIDIDTSGHDALKAAANIFSAYLPKWDVQPRGPKENDNAEILEAWLKWQYSLIDRRSGSSVWNLMKQSVTYDMYCARVDYLPYYIKGKKTAKQRNHLRNGSFVVIEEHPANILWERTPYGLEWVSVAENTLASEIMNYWLPYPEAKAGVDKLKELIENDEEATVNYFDYYDYDKRVVYFYESETLNEEDVGADRDVTYLLNGKNELGFIPWAISVGGTGYEKDAEHRVDPLIASLHRSGSWSNQCLRESLQTSKTMKRWGLPDMITVTPSGEGKEIDYTGNADQIALRAGEDAKPYVPPPLDPGLRELIDRGRVRMNRSVGVDALQNSGITGNMQFATFNAQIQIALASLAKPRRVAEQALTQIGIIMFEWLDFTGHTVSGFRTSDAGTEGPTVERGAQISISNNDFDMETLFISAKMMPNNPTDRLQRMNFAIQANKELQVPLSELLESLDLGNSDVLQERWQQEQLDAATLMTFIETQKQMALMQVQMQAQQAMQQQQPPGTQNTPGPQSGANTPPSQETANGPGFNAAEGGTPNQVASPADTREGLTGRTFGGQEIAG